MWDRGGHATIVAPPGAGAIGSFAEPPCGERLSRARAAEAGEAGRCDGGRHGAVDPIQGL